MYVKNHTESYNTIAIPFTVSISKIEIIDKFLVCVAKI